MCSLQLAQRLQLEEDEHARQVYQERLQQEEERLQQQGQRQANNRLGSQSQRQVAAHNAGTHESLKQKKKKEKGDCIIM
jgi:hypothetical protein